MIKERPCENIMTLSGALRYFYSHPSPWVLLIISSGFWCLRFATGLPVEPIEFFIGLGVIAYWPFQEWWMHRWLLHMGSIKIFGRTFEPDFARTHRLHHEKPDDMLWVFLPIRHILGSLVFFTTIGLILTQDLPKTCVFMGSASLSTLLYEWTHYLTHTNYKPKSNYYRKIWQLHRWHHYKHEGHWFSFTIPYIDGWFGTGPEPKSVKRSPTARTLGGDPFQKSEPSQTS